MKDLIKRQAAAPYSRSWSSPTFRYHLKPNRVGTRAITRRRRKTDTNELAQHNRLPSPRVFFLLMWIVFCSLCPLFSQAEKKGLELIRNGEELIKRTEYEKAMAKFEEAWDYIYTDTNKLRFYKNMSLVYYSLGKEKESVDYIMKALEIELNARLRGKIPPGFRIMFLNHQKRLKKLISDVRKLANRKLFAEARKRLEQSVEFKNHKNNKRVQELKNYIKEAENKEEGRNMN
jgi:tetratricopeptide (TPR) repeat protein